MDAPDFFVNELLDLANGGDYFTITDNFFDSVTGNSDDSSNVTPVGSSNSSVPGHDFSSFSDHCSNDLCVPYDDLPELEWLSNFVEQSFSTKDLPKHHLLPMQPIGPSADFLSPAHSPNPNSPSTVPGRARSKWSRVAPCDWSTRLLMVGPTSPATSSSDSIPTKKKPSSQHIARVREKSGRDEARRCLHCASEKTPQWRTGPMGPKTLCNACGVRYKSGRLVPEYRPAASPTFVSTKHSNSHRRVVELRRQKEFQIQKQQILGHNHHRQSMIMGVSNGGDRIHHHNHHLVHDYHHHMI